jgi:orotidine-5'-phosphate decarboxylase
VNARERLIVALDLPDAERARAAVARLGSAVRFYKVGSQLFTAAGPDFVRGLVDAGHPVFLDLKFHDIPNTVAAAVAAAAGLGVRFVDVHASGGAAMLQAASRALRGTGTRLLAITVLTSHSDATLAETGARGPVEDAVRRLARLAQQAGADGVVASPVEAAAIRAEFGPGFLVVTPGIRPAGSASFDQARLATPAAALRAGADYLVVGRPILEAEDPAATASAIVEEMEQAGLSFPA